MEYVPKYSTGQGCQICVTKTSPRANQNRPKQAQRPYPNIKTQHMLFPYLKYIFYTVVAGMRCTQFQFEND